MEVRVGPPCGRVRKWYRFGGISSAYEYIVHNHTLSNVVRGLNERVFCVVKDGKLVRPPRPVPGIFERKLGYARDTLVRLLPRVPKVSTTDFVDMYHGRRRVLYASAAESLLVKRVSKKDAELSTFVKAEKINVTLKSDPAPRIIQPRDPRYNVEVGRYLRPLEKPLMHAIDDLFGEPTAMKGYTVEQLGTIMHDKATRFKDPVFIGLDASRFDQHCSVEALQWEHSVYNSHFRDKKLRELLSWQIHNKGTAHTPDGMVRYAVNGCRMSGDMNTSMGNYLLMSCMVHAYLKEHGLLGDASLANCGDDCVLYLERRHLKRVIKTLPNWFLEMGYTMKVESPVYELEEVEFCQMHPVYTSYGWTMCRNVKTVLNKDMGCVSKITNDTEMWRWLGAQHNGGSRVFRGIPILNQLFLQFPDVESRNIRSEFAGDYKFNTWSKDKTAEITDDCRFSFWKAFKLTGDDQLLIEEQLRSWRPGVKIVDSIITPPCLADFAC